MSVGIAGALQPRIAYSDGFLSSLIGGIKFSDDQPRDENGRWAAVGSSTYGAGFKPNPMTKVEQSKAQAKGEISLAKAIRNKTDVNDAMERSDIGTIDFVWGNAGSGAPKNKGAHGLAGIIAKHSEKSLRAMPEVIAKGDLGEADPRYKGTRKIIRYKDYTAVISLVEGEKKRTWLLNGFGLIKDDPPEQQERLRKRGMIKSVGDGDIDEFSDNIDSTHLAPTRFSSQDGSISTFNSIPEAVDTEVILDTFAPTHYTPTLDASHNGSASVIDILAQTQHEGETNTMFTDTLIHYGGAIKTVEESETGWKFGGYLVVFGTQDVSSLKDCFTKSTDYDIADGDRRSLYYNHGMDGTVKRARLGDCRISIKDAGVWIDGEIKRRNDYLAKHAEQIALNIEQFGLSSGAPAHLVERKKVDGGHEVLLWPIAEASITPTPAEPMTGCVSLKSLAETKSTFTTPSLIETAADIDNDLLNNAIKALPAINPYIVTSTARQALLMLGERVIDNIGLLMNPDYQNYDAETSNYQTPTLEEKTAAAQKILEDYSAIAMSLFATMSQSAASFTETKNLSDLTDNLPAGLPLEDHSSKVLAAVKEIDARIDRFTEIRCIKSNRRWSADNYSRLNALADGLSESAIAIKARADDFAPRDEAAEFAKQQEAAFQAVAEYQLTLAKLNGVTI